ncbi:MAG TPA: sodium:proton antiporter, partial [Longimicrobium sp.]|nr:sodium:proton antiporter [Longimicrobium sp.]
FEGGITADLSSIRQNVAPIGMLATVGMVLAIGATGGALHFTLGLGVGPALLLGAILGVTDTVSILYAFRRVVVPSRLSGIMQGESLFNDGTALVAYAALVSVVAGSALSVPQLAVRVVLATAGGLVFGVALGLLAGFIIRHTEDPLAEIMATTALALASYVAAEQLHMSGAIAAVTAGLTVSAELRRSASPQSQVAIHSFWEYVAFGVNTFLFMSVGLSTHPASLLKHLPLILLAVACVFAGRAVAIYLPFLGLRLLRPTEAVPLRWQHVFLAGNIKGAISIALVLGLPESTPNRALMVDIAFGVTFVSLVVQGSLFSKALGWLRLLAVDPVGNAVAEQQARLIAARAARQELETLHATGMVPRMGYEHLRGSYQATIADAERELRRLQERHLAQGARLLLSARRRLLDAERSALTTAIRGGLVPEDAGERLLKDIDARAMDLEHVLAGSAGREDG